MGRPTRGLNAVADLPTWSVKPGIAKTSMPGTKTGHDNSAIGWAPIVGALYRYGRK
jgi:hypothetical protein